MAEALFGQILVMSVTASLVILAVILIRLCLRRAPKVFSYALWAVVLLRLICPVSFSSDLSLLGMVEESIAEEVMLEQEVGGGITGEEIVPGIFTEVPAIAGENVVGKENVGLVNVNRPSEVQGESLTFAKIKKTIALEWQRLEEGNPDSVAVRYGLPIWAVGLVVMAIYSLWSMVQMRRVLKDAVPEASARKLIGSKSGNVYLCDLETPFVYGVLHPRIYLSTDTEEKERDYILLHEQTHIRRGDHIIRMLSFLVLCIH